MVQKSALVLGCVAVFSAPAALAASASFQISATVGVTCRVQHQLAGYGEQIAGGFSLGELREYCNAQNGYELLVSYAPGTLRGTTIRAGDDEVVLNGSGQAVLSRAAGPRVLDRPVVALPGPSGFDSGSIQFSVIAT
jgi:hypothetical protein